MELYIELRLEAVEAIEGAEVKWSRGKLGLFSGEGVSIEATGEISPLDGALVIFVVCDVVLDVAEKAAAQG